MKVNAWRIDELTYIIVIIGDKIVVNYKEGEMFKKHKIGGNLLG